MQVMYLPSVLDAWEVPQDIPGLTNQVSLVTEDVGADVASIEACFWV